MARSFWVAGVGLVVEDQSRTIAIPGGGAVVLVAQVASIEIGHGTSSVLKGSASKAHTSDSLIESSTIVHHTSNSYLAKTLGARQRSFWVAGGGLVVEDRHRTVFIRGGGAIVLNRGAVTERGHDADSLLQAHLEKSHSSDSYLQGPLQVSHSADALIAGVVEPTTGLAPTVLPGPPREFTGNLATLEASHGADALLHGSSERAHSSSSYLNSIGTRDALHQADAYARYVRTKIATSDAFLMAVTSRAFLGDALLLRRGTKAHHADSYLHLGDSKVHTTDSALHGPVEKTFGTSSFLALPPPVPEAKFLVATARFGCFRFGNFRFGFTPEDVIVDEEDAYYAWDVQEEKKDESEWAKPEESEWTKKRSVDGE